MSDPNQLRKPRRPEPYQTDWSPRSIPQPAPERRTADPRTPKLRELEERERQRAPLAEQAAPATARADAPIAPPAATPCSGRGALADPERARRFGTMMWSLHDRWEDLNAEGRRVALQNAVREHLTPPGMPAADVVPFDFGAASPIVGELNSGRWELQVSKQLLSPTGGAITHAQWQNLEKTLYHEARHAEQMYLLTRREAATETDRFALWQRTGVSDSVVRVAMANPLRPLQSGQPYTDDRTAAGGPRSAGTPAASSSEAALVACADAMRTAYIANTAERSAVQAELRTAWQDTTPAAAARRRAAYLRYPALPEESDAFAAEDLYYATAWGY